MGGGGGELRLTVRLCVVMSAFRARAGVGGGGGYIGPRVPHRFVRECRDQRKGGEKGKPRGPQRQEQRV